MLIFSCVSPQAELYLFRHVPSQPACSISNRGQTPETGGAPMRSSAAGDIQFRRIRHRVFQIGVERLESVLFLDLLHGYGRVASG